MSTITLGGKIINQLFFRVHRVHVVLEMSSHSCKRSGFKMELLVIVMSVILDFFTPNPFDME